MRLRICGQIIPLLLFFDKRNQSLSSKETVIPVYL